ncbi:hypothetical protein EYF80_039163 [Liparis tanakae]|uniref:Uncharacterized protein n=1 Tax=Liparis tanakae TaxID=230148 RepID=A0A4Z2GBM4_9TELE|nr:hypothetical protein EYF80_039163 [Liparis tanakae]
MDGEAEQHAVQLARYSLHLHTKRTWRCFLNFALTPPRLVYCPSDVSMRNRGTPHSTRNNRPMICPATARRNSALLAHWPLACRPSSVGNFSLSLFSSGSAGCGGRWSAIAGSGRDAHL